MPHTTVDSSGGVVGLIQWNTDEGRCLLENPSEMLTKAALLVLYPAAQVLWLDSHVVVFSSCGLQIMHVVLWRRVFTDPGYNMWRVFCGCHQPVVRCCCILLLCIYDWAVVILLRLVCWIWVLACDSERIGRYVKSPANRTRNLTSFLKTP